MQLCFRKEKTTMTDKRKTFDSHKQYGEKEIQQQVLESQLRN